MKVYASLTAWNKMSYWAALGGKKHREFTCFGRAHHDKGDLFVTDVYLVKQEGTSGGVDGDDADINRLMMELFEKGIEPDEAFRCWIHSHPGTGPTATYLSGTDDANIERYLTGQWLISIVLDSNGDNPFCQVDIKEPRMSIKSELEIALPKMDSDVKKACEEEFEEKSSGRTYTVFTGGKKDSRRHSGYDGYGGYGGYGGGYVHGGRYGHSGHSGYSGGNKEKPSGKGNGAAEKTSGGAGRGVNGTRRPGADIDGMTMYGMDKDEYDAWLEYISNEDEVGVPAIVAASDTDEIPIGQQPLPLDSDSVPEWVISMADKLAISVEDLVKNIDMKDYDKYIDDIVISVQSGHKTMDAAVVELEKVGIDKDVAEKELKTRVNA